VTCMIVTMKKRMVADGARKSVCIQLSRPSSTLPLNLKPKYSVSALDRTWYRARAHSDMLTGMLANLRRGSTKIPTLMATPPRRYVRPYVKAVNRHDHDI
jgi:hypothetical protein